MIILFGWFNSFSLRGWQPWQSMICVIILRRRSQANTTTVSRDHIYKRHTAFNTLIKVVRISNETVSWKLRTSRPKSGLLPIGWETLLYGLRTYKCVIARRRNDYCRDENVMSKDSVQNNIIANVNYLGVPQTVHNYFEGDGGCSLS
jgi:hypothetical protein